MCFLGEGGGAVIANLWDCDCGLGGCVGVDGCDYDQGGAILSDVGAILREVGAKTQWVSRL